MNGIIAIKEKHLKVRAKSILASDTVWKLTQTDYSLKPVLDTLNEVADILREFWRRDRYTEMANHSQYKELADVINDYETAIDALLKQCNVSLDEALLDNAYRLFPSSQLSDKTKLFG